MSKSLPKSGALVLFDIDGTLIRGAGPHHRQALIEGIRRVTALDTDMEGIATAGTLDRDLIAAMLRARGQSERRIRDSLAQIMAECQNWYADQCPLDLTTFVCPGVRELITELARRGVTLGLVTGNLTRIGWKKVELAELREFFSVGAFAEDGRSRARLAQVARRRAIREGLVARSGKVSLIGDHLNDVKAAKLNGFQSIAVGTGILSVEELQDAEPDIAVRDLTELDPEALL